MAGNFVPAQHEGPQATSTARHRRVSASRRCYPRREGDSMRMLGRRMRRVAVPLAALVCLAAASGAVAAGSGTRDNGNGNDPGFQGESSKIKDVDARKGKKDPSAQQQN